MNLLGPANAPEDIAIKTGLIGETILQESRHVREANFGAIHPDDLARIFNLYDRDFFDGWLNRTVVEKTGHELAFRLSSTMTRAGGKTIRTRVPQSLGRFRTSYEIAIGSRLLFMTFRKFDRPVVVCGFTCVNRLQALQRIMEHEITHLSELLMWNRSSCSAGRFKLLAKNIFGHSGTTHDLVTPAEQAAVEHDITVGQRVEFRFDGVRRVGIVNRIRHRATILVESSAGRKYSDGKNYEKFYIPVPMLARV